MKFLSDRPWWLVVAAFLILIAAWTAWITFAQHHAPVAIPLELPHGR